jgi:hypothetical protein
MCSFILIVLYTDPYALLFSDKKKIIFNEKRTKYLFSYKYIPENFDGILVGPSYSDNINIKMIGSKNVYNMSLNGGNIFELEFLIDNIMNNENRQVKFIIFSLSPYLFLNDKVDKTFIHNSTLRNAFFSIHLVKHFLYYLKYYVLESTNIYDKSENGYINYNKLLNNDVEKLITNSAAQTRHISINNSVYETFNKILIKLRKSNIKIFAYFHPIPEPIYSSNKSEYLKFFMRIRKCFKVKEKIINFNTSKYTYITKVYKNYSDEGHLSISGAELILQELKKEFEIDVMQSLGK